MLEFLQAHFRLTEADEIATGDVSRHSERGTTATRDIVLSKKSDELLAGQVWHHINVNGNFFDFDPSHGPHGREPSRWDRPLAVPRQL